ncbi:MAG: hypothetical protein JWO31_2956, partial [Phycisphaerales bacterium]|nr:hypothetical protein [Phycisphaerales bacterium]
MPADPAPQGDRLWQALRRPAFWSWAAVGWLVTLVFLGLVIRLFGMLDALTERETWVVGAACYTLALISATVFARRKVAPVKVGVGVRVPVTEVPTQTPTRVSVEYRRIESPPYSPGWLAKTSVAGAAALWFASLCSAATGGDDLAQAACIQLVVPFVFILPPWLVGHTVYAVCGR